MILKRETRLREAFIGDKKGEHACTRHPILVACGYCASLGQRATRLDMLRKMLACRLTHLYAACFGPIYPRKVGGFKI